MKKLLRLSLTSLLMLVCGTTFAQTTFDFDNDYATLFPTLAGTSSGSSHDGDFTEATTSEALNGITVTVSAKTNNSSDNRIWNSTPRLRMYSGTLTITAPADKNIVNITFDAKSSNWGVTPNAGELSGMTWTGSNNEVVFTVNKNTQIKSLTVFLEGEEGGEVVNISNTPETAYSVAKAHELIEAGESLSTPVYVKGIITKIGNFNSNYGQLDYYINDADGVGEDLYVYGGLYLNNEKFTEELVDLIKVGDEVIVYGQLQDYKGTHEFNYGNYIYSLNGVTTGIDNITVELELDENAPVYNLSGQRVSKDTKGILIQNGKKFINR